MSLVAARRVSLLGLLPLILLAIAAPSASADDTPAAAPAPEAAPSAAAAPAPEAASAAAPAPAAAAGPPEFKQVISGKPLNVAPRGKEVFTPAVESFHATGQNPYNGDPAALAEGKKLYNKMCQACHMPDGSGRMGPSLIGDKHKFAVFPTDAGMFSIIYGGASGAMQAFSKRVTVTQDQMLQIMAYVRSLKK